MGYRFCRHDNTGVDQIALLHVFTDSKISDVMSLPKYLVALSQTCEKAGSKTVGMDVRIQENSKTS
jgi:hypothetical protein